MRIETRILIVTGATLSIALLTGCQTTTSAPPAIAPTAGSYVAHDNLNATLWQQHSSEAAMLQMQTYNAAAKQLQAALQDQQWNALSAQDLSTSADVTAKNLPPAIIVDVDETVLDNSAYQARLIRDLEKYNPTSWDAWVREEKANAIAGAAAFLNQASRHGVTVFYLSNRVHTQQEPTLANLRKAGFPVADDQQFLGRNTEVGNCSKTGSDKSCRRQYVGKNYRVIMQFGDQLGDFIEIIGTTSQARREILNDYAQWIGARWFILPNPTYGSWEAAAIDNSENISDDARRELKYKALDFR